MQYRIEHLPETLLAGTKQKMSFLHNQTAELWRSFMPRRGLITGAVGAELYSVEVYDGVDFFRQFNPAREFEKWAAVRVAGNGALPEGMESLALPAGRYAVFTYKGKPADAGDTYRYIYGEWMARSAFRLDDRPHFALMGEKYKGDSPGSEEELWIPITDKDGL